MVDGWEDPEFWKPGAKEYVMNPAMIMLLVEKLTPYFPNKPKTKADCAEVIAWCRQRGWLYEDSINAFKQLYGEDYDSYLESLPEEGFDKKQWVIPSDDKLISEGSKELSLIIRKSEDLFYRPELGKVCEIIDGSIKIMGCERFVTKIEQYVCPGARILNKMNGRKEFNPRSIGINLSKIILSSSEFQNHLPHINNIFAFQLPRVHNGELILPDKGYDPRFKSWTDPNCPEIDYSLTLEDSKKVIDDIFKEFCFKEPQDKINAIAFLLTPYLRGLYNNPSARTPIFALVANRERSGKDYLAGLRSIIFDGRRIENPPIGENNELRKNLSSALIAGTTNYHSSNNKGHIDSSVLESISTAEVFSDRVLGGNDIFKLPNLLELSLSGNMGITFSADLANRARFISLFLDVEDANSRKFNNPDLHNWVMQNRAKILSCLHALIKNWVDKGMPSSSIAFTSFPEWARVCGGILECCEVGSPCVTDLVISGSFDSETEEMKRFFELGYQEYQNSVSWRGQNGWVGRNHIIELVEKEELFSYLDFNKNSDKTKFGMKLSKFMGRWLSGIKLEVDNNKVRGSRQRFRFVTEEDINKQSKLGTAGSLGNTPIPDMQKNSIGILELDTVSGMPTVPNLRMGGWNE